MCTTRLLAIFTAVLGMCDTHKVAAQTEHVFLVKSADCRGGAYRAQTGCRVQGIRGIVTTLHGIADCKTIIAVDDEGRVRWNGLKIHAVDVPRDVAIVTSPALNQEALAGLVPVSAAITADPQAVRVIGHPYGMIKQIDDYPAHPPAVRLVGLIPGDPPTTRMLFGRRGSPDTSALMLRIQGALVPGHSGSPIVLPDFRLVGVADGGLYGGTVQRSWAIPWWDIVWSTDLGPVGRLASGDQSALFSLDERYVPVYPLALSLFDSSNAELGSGRAMSTSVVVSASGLVSAATTAATASVLDGFCGNVAVTYLSDRDSVLAQRALAVPLCVGMIDGSGLTTSRTEHWTTRISDSATGRLARIRIRHFAEQRVGGMKMMSAIALPEAQRDSVTSGIALAFERAQVTTRTHLYFEGSKHLLSEAALSPTGALRVVTRLENDDIGTGFRARVVVEAFDAAGQSVYVSELPELSRRGKSPGRAMCTDTTQVVDVPSHIAATVRSLRVSAKDRGRFADFTLLGSDGFRCVGQKFLGVGEQRNARPQ